MVNGKSFGVIQRETDSTFPFTIYLSWICVATMANIAAWLTSVDFMESMSTQTIFTIVMMIVASALALRIVLQYRDYAYPAVTLWALAGIALKGIPVITPAAIVIAAGLFIVVVVRFVQSKNKTFTN